MSCSLCRATTGLSPGRALLRRNEDRQDADDLPAFGLLHHHQIDVEAVPGGLGPWLARAQLGRRVDLGDAPADRDDPQLLLVDVDLPRALVALFQRLERRLTAPDGLAPADPEHVRRGRKKAAHS